MKFKVLLIGILIHLSVLLAGLAPVSVWPQQFVTYFLGPYARLTGAGASYGFFSPNVGNQLQVRFYGTYQDGITKEIWLEDVVTAEVAVRVGNMYRMLGQIYANERFRRSTTASLTTYLFNSDPAIAKIKTVVELYEVPSLWQLPLGHKIVVRPIYDVTFKRD